MESNTRPTLRNMSTSALVYTPWTGPPAVTSNAASCTGSQAQHQCRTGQAGADMRGGGEGVGWGWGCTDLGGHGVRGADDVHFLVLQEAQQVAVHVRGGGRCRRRSANPTFAVHVRSARPCH